MQNNNGFTLIELLLVLTIIILFSFAVIPAFDNIVKKAQSQKLSSQLLRAINLTRNEAVVRGISITLCGSKNGSICSNEWQNGFIIITNENKALFSFTHHAKGVLHWRGSLGRTNLEYLPSGLTNNEDGTFWYCENNHDAVWAIVINLAGRARLVIPEQPGKIRDDQGKLLVC